MAWTAENNFHFNIAHEDDGVSTLFPGMMSTFELSEVTDNQGWKIRVHTPRDVGHFWTADGYLCMCRAIAKRGWAIAEKLNIRDAFIERFGDKPLNKHYILTPTNEAAALFVQTAPTVFMQVISVEIAQRYTWHFEGEDKVVLTDVTYKQELHFAAQ